MRVVRENFGIIFVDNTEILLRVYKTENNKWQLVHYDSCDLLDTSREKTITAYTIAEVIAEFFSKTFTQEVVEWRICARNISRQMVYEIAQAVGLKIEYLERIREQELISKGLFTEAW